MILCIFLCLQTIISETSTSVIYADVDAFDTTGNSLRNPNIDKLSDSDEDPLLSSDSGNEHENFVYACFSIYFIRTNNLSETSVKTDTAEDLRKDWNIEHFLASDDDSNFQASPKSTDETRKSYAESLNDWTNRQLLEKIYLNSKLLLNFFCSKVGQN